LIWLYTFFEDFGSFRQPFRKELHVKRDLLKYSVVILALGLSTCTAAFGFGKPSGPSVPEVDPSLAIGGLTLLAGSIAVLRIRRKK
jgi:LPXTG-motif cell wall-anchored protein